MTCATLLLVIHAFSLPLFERHYLCIAQCTYPAQMDDSKPETSQDFFERGNSRLDEKSFDMAIDDFTQAIRLDPKFEMAFRNRAIAHHRKRDFDKAIKDYSEAIRLDPKNAEVYIARGAAWAEQRQYDKAIDNYSDAIRIDSCNVAAFYSRGNSWCDKGEYDKAISDYNEALHLNPEDAPSYVGRGFCWCNKKEFDKAIKDSNEAIRLDPDYPHAFIFRARCWLNQREFEKAKDDYAEAMKLDSEDLTVCMAVATFNATCPIAKYRDGKRAVELATQACETTLWKDPYCLDVLATAYAESGDFDKAIKYVKEAMDKTRLDEDMLFLTIYTHYKTFEKKKPYHEP